MKLVRQCLHGLWLSACLSVSAHGAETWVRAESEHFVVTSSTTET